VAIWLVAVLAGVLSAGAVAQVSADAALVSDYRFRGVSLSDNQAAAQIDANLDLPSADAARAGYAGLFASTVRFDSYSPTREQALAYAGYSLRLRQGWSIDAGASYSSFPGNSEYEYLELHAGVTREDLAVRLYVSPDYFGQGSHTVYAEINGSHRVAQGIRLFGHAGVLELTSGPMGSGHAHGDARAGVELSYRIMRLQLSRVVSSGQSPAYPVGENQSNGAWVASLIATF